MKIYTGYFAKIKSYERKDFICISIAGKAPSFFHWFEYKKLAPPYSLFRAWKDKKIDNREYTKVYNQFLDTLDCLSVYEELKVMTHNLKCILLCYEKTGDFCHRHLVAKWFTENGKKVTEFME